MENKYTHHQRRPARPALRNLSKKHAPNFNQEALFNFFITASTLQTASVETPDMWDQLPTGAGPTPHWCWTREPQRTCSPNHRLRKRSQLLPTLGCLKRSWLLLKEKEMRLLRNLQTYQQTKWSTPWEGDLPPHTHGLFSWAGWVNQPPTFRFCWTSSL